MREASQSLFLIFPLLPLAQTHVLGHRCNLDCFRRWQINPKQDHLVCFLGGSLLLGVTEARLSVPPNSEEFSQTDLEDWELGTGLIKTCVDTYNTAT